MLNFLKKSRGILGMNSRNLDFIKPGSSKRKIRLVNDKLRTKKLLQRHDLPVSKLYSVVKNRQEFYAFDWDSLPKSFVLKPNKGLGGEGIMVTFGQKKNGDWVLPLNKDASIKEVQEHVSNILDGDYSKHSVPDEAFFEERLKIHPAFKLYSYKGIPDIRIVVYNKVPVMAMLRLPTKSSSGKANLHQKGLGLGIDISEGLTTYAIQNDKPVEFLPGSKFPLRGIRIPYWNQILEIAVESQVVSGLNYVGVDIAIDREKGPVVLELNAYPGLSIQNANLSSLRDRLERIKGLKIKTTKKGIKVGKELFGGEVEQEIEEMTGKQVIGLIEKIKLSGKNKRELELKAKLDTGAGISAIDEELAIALGFESALSYYKSFNLPEIMTKEEVDQLTKKRIGRELKKHDDISQVVKVHSSHGSSYRIEVPVKLVISGIPFRTNVSVCSRGDLDYPMIIGRRDLKRFLVDPTKTVK